TTEIYTTRHTLSLHDALPILTVRVFGISSRERLHERTPRSRQRRPDHRPSAASRGAPPGGGGGRLRERLQLLRRADPEHQRGWPVHRDPQHQEGGRADPPEVLA